MFFCFFCFLGAGAVSAPRPPAPPTSPRGPGSVSAPKKQKSMKRHLLFNVFRIPKAEKQKKHWLFNVFWHPKAENIEKHLLFCLFCTTNIKIPRKTLYFIWFSMIFQLFGSQSLLGCLPPPVTWYSFGCPCPFGINASTRKGQNFIMGLFWTSAGLTIFITLLSLLRGPFF